MRRLLAAALLVACTGLMGSSRADDDDPSGTWNWTTPKGVGTLKLKLEGEKVTGVMVRKAGDLKVEDGVFKDGAISFRVPGKTPGGKRTSAHVPRQSCRRYHHGLGHDRAAGSMRLGRLGSNSGQALEIVTVHRRPRNCRR